MVPFWLEVKIYLRIFYWELLEDHASQKLGNGHFLLLSQFGQQNEVFKGDGERDNVIFVSTPSDVCGRLTMIIRVQGVIFLMHHPMAGIAKPVDR